jgi:hypothetical protein
VKKMLCAALAAILSASAAQAGTGNAVLTASPYRLDRASDAGVAQDLARKGVHFILPGEELFQAPPRQFDTGPDAALVNAQAVLQLDQDRLDARRDTPSQRESAIVELGLKYRF